MERIGFIRTPYQQKFATPRQPGLTQSVLGRIEIYPQYQPELSLDGLAGFSHVWVLFEFHLVSQEHPFQAKVHPPRASSDQKIGLFATRSPHRPNRIGLSLCQISSVDSQGLWVIGPDIVDQSPILDLKPYLPHFDSPKLTTEQASHHQFSSGWTENQALDISTEVSWSHEALQQLESFAEPPVVNFFKKMIDESLGQDPRPRQDRETQKTHHALIAGIDIQFRVNQNNVQIQSCRKSLDFELFVKLLKRE